MYGIRNYAEVAERVESIPGFLMHGQEKWLFDTVRDLPDGSIVLELGSHLGRSTAAMAFACVGTQKRIVCLDLWNDLDSDDSAPPANLPKFLSNMQDRGLKPFVTAVPGLANMALEAWHAGPVSFAFIDDGHTYEAVTGEFALIERIAAPRAMIAVHDVGCGWEGCDRAWTDISSRLTDHQFCGSIAAGRIKPKE